MFWRKNKDVELTNEIAVLRSHLSFEREYRNNEMQLLKKQVDSIEQDIAELKKSFNPKENP